MGLAAMKNRSNSSKQRLFHGNALPRARGLYRSQETAKTSLQYQWVAQRVQDTDDVSNSGGNQIET